MSEERDLDAELTRLFADDRLSLPVAPEATEHVLAGVRRRRRRRGAASAAAGVLLTGGLLAGSVSIIPGAQRDDRADRTAIPTRQASRPPASAVSSGSRAETTPPSTDAPPTTQLPTGTPSGGPDTGAPDEPTLGPEGRRLPNLQDGQLEAVLGPDGVNGSGGRLTLGMSAQAALDSGLLRPDAVRQVPGCAAYLMRDYPGPSGSAVTVSVTDTGVTAFAGTSVFNADGVRTEATTEDVLDRYPDATVRGDTITADVADDPAADYLFQADTGTVQQIVLRLDSRPRC